MQSNAKKESMNNTLSLYWSSRSPFARKVTITAHELGLSDRIKLIPTLATPVNLDPALLEANPLAQLPTLTLANGQSIYGSALICEYLNQLEGNSKLIPKDLDSRWITLSRQSLADGLNDINLFLRLENRDPAMARQKLCQGYLNKREAVLHRMETDISSVQTSAFSIGDIATGCALSYLDFRMPEVNWRTTAPNLSNWYNEFLTRPSVITNPLIDPR